ncbi:Werner Syndrome-like exonuclease isoform X2 [Copidosoma floridanum]|uniref:Werner Syndrome-like exonuclease isoform X2 n=1 Tax=Copidosoma floridanum TaxID=29053 RepID=UPI0006C973C7|nr:Werner Syndrome-like exonuclease isoform X2 [Copidosoma floridanum]
MSKAKASAANAKRSRPITAWLKKTENLVVEEKETDEVSAKLLKLIPRVCLEPLDDNILKQSNVIDGVKNLSLKNSVTTKKVKNWLKKDKSSENQVKDLRRSARNLPPNEKEKLVKTEIEPDIKSLPAILFKGRINYIHDFYDIASLCDKLLTDVKQSNETVIPVGFDLEWPFSFQTGSGKTALAQICLSEKECHLLHLYNIKKLPSSFIEFLSHSKVKLVGVNIKNDVWKLTRDFKEFPGQKVVDNNCLDCGPHVNSVLNRSCRWSLERLTAYLLKKKISKDPAVRKSKWHIHPLSNSQKLYAATDAYVSLLLHLTIEQRKAEISAKEAEKKAENEIKIKNETTS